VRKEKLKKEKNMNESEIVEYVENNARYYNDDSFEPYAVMYEGKFICGESPRNLVEQLMNIVNG